MSSPNPHASRYEQEPSAKQVLIGLALLLIGAISLCIPSLRSLVFGWFFFLDRSLGTFQPDWPTFWVGLAAFALLSIVIHRLGRRQSARWTGRSTMALSFGVVLLFAASVAMVASVHQVLWLTSNSISANPKQGANWGRPAGPLSIISQAQQAALRTQSKNQIHNVMLAVHNYQDTFLQFPPGAIIGPNGRGYRGWMPALQGFSGFYSPRDFSKKPWDDPEIADLWQGALPEVVHPELGWHGQFDERGFALMHYAGNVHVFPNNRGMKLSEITDGESNTLAIGEVAENFQPWASPWNRRDPADGINDVPWGFGGPPWQQGAQFGMMDGTVRFVSRNIDRELLKALGTPAGHEEVPSEW